MKSITYVILVSCIYLLVAFANTQLRFTDPVLIQIVWVAFLIVPLNRWLASKLSIKG